MDGNFDLWKVKEISAGNFLDNLKKLEYSEVSGAKKQYQKNLITWQTDLLDVLIEGGLS